MTHEEFALRQEFNLLPDEARVLSYLLSEIIVPHECVHHCDNARKVIISRLRKKTGLRIEVVRRKHGLQLDMSGYYKLGRSTDAPAD